MKLPIGFPIRSVATDHQSTELLIEERANRNATDASNTQACPSPVALWQISSHHPLGEAAASSRRGGSLLGRRWWMVLRC
jgi:hypothetical protein